MGEEIAVLIDNENYDLVTPQEGRQIVGGGGGGEEWVFAVKTGPNGEESHKARYVAKCYSQIAEVDYQR